MDAVGDENIRVLHRNMLFPVQSVTDLDSVIVNNVISTCFNESKFVDGFTF